MAGQTATLFRARFAAFGNARRAGAGAYRPAVLVTVFIALGLIAVLGHFAAPTLLTVPDETVTVDLGGRAPVVGESALEAAFWLGTLLCAFFAFRVMESLFRASKIRAIELLPVRPGPIFAERAINSLAEAVLLALGAALFFLPLTWHGAAPVAALCALIGIGATISTAAVTIGTNIWFGAQYGGAKGFGDAYGGHGGAFIYAPVVSFALAVICVLLLQLGAREVLHAGEITNAFWLAVGIPLGIAAAAILLGARHFIASYYRVAAFFREADEVGFRAVMDYQESTWEPVRGEALASGAGAYVFRRHVLQFGRRYPVARTIVAIGCVGAAIGAWALSSAAFPDWAVAIVPAALFAVLERPFARLDDDVLGTEADVLLPISEAKSERSRLAWTVWELGRIALPYAAVVGVARVLSESVATGALVAAGSMGMAAALAATVALVRRFGITSRMGATGISIATCIALGAVLAWNLLAGALATWALTTLAGIVLFPQLRGTS